MSLRVYETDPEAKPRKRDRFSTDLVGNLKAGMQVNGTPMTLDDWRFTSDDPAVAARIAELYGGEVEEMDVDKGDDHQVLSTTRSIRVLVEGPSSLRSKMILFGRKGPIHECDGMFSLMDEDKGEPCGCPEKMEDRKAQSKSGRGPSPSIELKFLLADDPELGFFRFRTGSWSLVSDLPEIEDALAERAGDAPIEVVLRLERVEYTTRAGRDVSYVRSHIEVQ